ncbi:MAG TPA: aminotransferase class I/II-fold pyridoxal phosphate-dependent enzyme [Candidatus Saccharimonadales bacterium]|jgi:histidinol-phosphate aminotransferase|nr:aminotransferase class I/II-fold pyridoxal phosphate-dependent enzyme [Candidatus Saccharimonadales bacterium]
MLTRRSFFKTAGLGAAVAASANFSTELLSWAEPARAPQPGGPILLNSNENAYGPFPSVLAMGNPFLEAHRYPDHRIDLLGEKLAALHKVSNHQLVAGCGSSEILRLAACAFTGVGRKLVMAAPTFESIGDYAEVLHTEVVRVPLAANFTHDLGAMLKAAGTDAGLVYICNPNNPTANLTPRKDLEEFIARLPRNTMVLMDEAYHDFVGDHPDYVSFLERPVDDDRVVVARTFSKIYGLAGMRLGYGVGSKAAIKTMSAHRLSDPLNTLVIRCAMVSLDDAAGHRQAQQRNAADRAEFIRQAAARKITTIPSSTNFVMVHTGKPIRGVIEHFRKNNVAIGRPFPPLDTYARISLGKPQEMKEFWKVWDGGS